MTKQKFFFIYCLFALIIVIVAGALIFKSQFIIYQIPKLVKNTGSAVLGNSLVADTSIPTITLIPTPTFMDYAISIITGPKELSVGDTATFTWSAYGPSTTIHTSAIYYGTTSNPGDLTKSATGDNTSYTGVVKDFFQGDYRLPIQFIANTKLTIPGTYYYRAYAIIDGKNYWTDEHSFIVKSIPKNEIKIVNPPVKLSHDDNATFTWEVSGPSASTGFSTIVMGTVSKPGPLDNSIDVSKTSYTTILIHDFTTGIYAVPLRFIGNAKISQPGIYYYRAVAVIGGNNLWSDEYTLTVQ